jgi:2-(1,2-epoxy-1,2-dihydrophenyl)acetyl-CoA isomerase
MSEQVLTKIEGAVARITFNRPEVRNAVNHEMLVAMREFLKRIEHDTSVRCVVLAGAGEHFMSGADVGNFKEPLGTPNEQRGRDFEARVQSTAGLFVMLARIPQPVVASVRGAVAGAALGFVAGADFVVCGSSSIFVLAHVRIGACPDGSSTYYLPRVLGVRKAKELAILGVKMSAEEARQSGLVNFVVPDSEVESRTEQLVKRIIDAPRRSVQWAKRLMNTSLDNSLETQLQGEARGFGECAGSDDFAEGVSAFLEKRAATFNRDGKKPP